MGARKYDQSIADEARRLYASGMRKSDIAKRFGCGDATVRRWLSEEEDRGGKSGCGSYIDFDTPVNGGITQKDIDRIRKKIKIGTMIKIRTCKASSGENAGGGLTGVYRRAKVVSTENKRFCTVMLPSGVLEQVLWQDLVRK